MIKDVLLKIRSGTATDTDTLATSLGLQRSALMARLEFLVDERYLEVVGNSCDCSTSCFGCGGAQGTGAKDAGSDCSGIYTLTTKGEQFIAQD